MLNYTDFDRIHDIIMYFDNNFSLGFVTRLSSKSQTGYRKFYEFQSEYPINKYAGVDKGHSIKRIMFFYYIIENKQYFDSSMILKANDVYIIRNIIDNSVFPWFFGSTRIYKEKDERLVITGDFQPVSYIQNLQRWLRIEPIVISYEDGFKEGVRIYVNSDNDFMDLSLDKFIEFVCYMDPKMMYTQSMAQCNYVKIAPYDSNMISVGGGLGSGGINNGDRLADNIYNNSPPKPVNSSDNIKNNKRNNFLDNAKKKS